MKLPKQGPLTCVLLIASLSACFAPVGPGPRDTRGLYQHPVSARDSILDSKGELADGSADMQRTALREATAEREAPVLVIPGAAWMEADLEGFWPERQKLFYDLRGRGRSRPLSQRTPISLESDVADLEALRQEHGLDQIDLLGWGYTGGVVLRYAMDYPERVRRIVLVSPLPPRFEPYWIEYQKRYAQSVDAEAFAALDHWRASGRKGEDPLGYARAYTQVTWKTFTHDPSVAQAVRSQPFGTQNPDPERIARLNERIFHRLGAWSFSPEHIGQVHQPVLLFHGREDLLPLAASEEYARHLPQAQLEILADCGRLPWLEAPERFAHRTESFLNAE